MKGPASSSGGHGQPVCAGSLCGALGVLRQLSLWALLLVVLASCVSNERNSAAGLDHAAILSACVFELEGAAELRPLVAGELPVAIGPMSAEAGGSWAMCSWE